MSAPVPIDLLPDGLYLHLPEEIYFLQGRLGSTDIARLSLRKEGWWWQSDLNPDKPKQAVDNQAKNFGRALHKIVLEGVDAYEATFCIAPSKTDFKELCVTSGEIEEALNKRNVYPKGNLKKAQLIGVAQLRAPDILIWDVILKKHRREVGDRAGVTTGEDRFLRIMADAIRSHKEIGKLFTFGPDNLPLAEVTVLWTNEFGVKRRGRLDLMLPTVTADLKSLRGANLSRPLEFSVPEAMANHGYDVQMADHHVARRWAYRFIREGNVHGASDDELAWLKRFPTEAPTWGYCWLFYQKPDPAKGHAPIVFPWWEDYGDDLHRRGLRKGVAAMDLYRRCMAEFGPDQPWSRVDPLHVTTEGLNDRVFLPSWIGGDERLPDEEELLAL